jgi:hypothetical protein
MTKIQNKMFMKGSSKIIISMVGASVNFIKVNLNLTNTKDMEYTSSFYQKNQIQLKLFIKDILEMELFKEREYFLKMLKSLCHNWIKFINLECLTIFILKFNIIWKLSRSLKSRKFISDSFQVV